VPRIDEAMAALRVKSATLDGERVMCDDNRAYVTSQKSVSPSHGENRGSSRLGSANDFKVLVKFNGSGDPLYGKCTAWTVPLFWLAGE
jgi:hypothetical protein